MSHSLPALDRANRLQLVGSDAEVSAPAPPAPHRERAERAAGRTGRSADEIALHEFDLSHYTEEGVFGHVDTGGCGALYRQLDWRELGVVLPSTTIDIRASRIALLPNTHRLPLMRRASQAHAALARWSFTRQVTRTVLQRGDLRWIPWRAWEPFAGEFAGVRAALEADKAALLGGYDAVRAEMRGNFGRIARESRRRLLATDATIPTDFVEGVVERLLGALPTPDELRARLFVRFEVGVLFLGSEMVAEQGRAVAARAAHATAEERARVALLETRRRSHAVQQGLWADEAIARGRVRAAEEEARREAAVKERLRGLRLDAEQRKLAEIMSPVEEIGQQLRAMVYEVAAAALDSLRKNRATLHGSTARGLRDLVRRYRALDITDDAALRGMVGEIERTLARPVGKRQKRDTAAIAAVLEDLKSYTYERSRLLLDPAANTIVEL